MSSVPRAAACLLFVSAAPAWAQSPPAPERDAQAPDPSLTESPPPPGPAEQEVIVSGTRGRSFTSRTQLTGTRATRSVDDVPQSITAVDGALLDSLGARRAAEALPLVPGVQLGTGFGGVWDDATVRGSRVWSGTMYRNGFLGGYSAMAATDAVNVERLEVLRGPAAALYGPGLPGGTINVITKRPEPVARQDLRLGVGSFGTGRLTLDSTGPLSSRVLYRVTGALEGSSGQRDFNDREQLLLDPVFVYELGPGTRWLVESQIYRVRYRPDPSGAPAVDGDPFALPRRRSIIEPHTPRTRFDGFLLRTEVTHRLSPDLLLRFGAQRQTALEKERTLFPLGFRPDGRTLERLAAQLDLQAEDIAAQAGVEVGGELFGLRHDAVLGIDARSEDVDYTLGASAPSVHPYPLDVYEPNYGAPFPAIHRGPPSRWTYQDVGLYGNELVELLPALRVSAGARVDAYRQTSSVATVEESKSKLAPSGRLGVLVHPSSWSTLYVSASRGFWPVLGVTADGSLLEAESSLGVELGTRTTLLDEALTLDAAVFRLDNENISVPDPERPDFQVQRGASRSEGLETFVTFTWHDVRAVGGYTWTHARVTADTDPSLVGRDLPLAPRHSGALWIESRAPLDEELNLEVGLGGRATGERSLNDGSTIPGYVRLDASAGLQDGPLRARLWVQNLLDADFVASGNDQLALLRGAGRSFYAELGWLH